MTDPDKYHRAARAKNIEELADQCGFIMTKDVDRRPFVLCPVCTALTFNKKDKELKIPGATALGP